MVNACLAEAGALRTSVMPTESPTTAMLDGGLSTRTGGRGGTGAAASAPLGAAVVLAIGATGVTTVVSRPRWPGRSPGAGPEHLASAAAVLVLAEHRRRWADPTATVSMPSAVTATRTGTVIQAAAPRRRRCRRAAAA